ncbi:MAG: DUF3857 domain-containing protein [Opitutae bacterium]|nr:DUF3857 domain-containing protein [Opitutae bacterium]
MAALIVLWGWPTSSLRAGEAIDPASLIAPELPAWVATPLPLPQIPAITGAATFPSRLMVLEQQIHVPMQAQFSHVAMRIETEAGLQSAGQINLSYAPSYQQLRWHYLRIWRAGQMREALTAGGLQVLRQEEDAERFTYHGRVTVLAILRDLRVGDIVEYAFTRTGENPVFAGRFSRMLSGASSAPVDRLYYRVLTTPQTALQVVAQGGFSAEHRSVMQGGLCEQTWQAADLKAVQPLTDAPGWEIQYPFLQLTEFADWPEVADWGRRLFALSHAVDPAVRARVAELTAGMVTQEEKANALLRFVQDEIRYLAIHLGESTHRPSPPAEVLERRYGDCKDKSLLLVAMLREIGLVAHVALVHSDFRRHVRGLQPSPLAFDHAIVQVQMPLAHRTGALRPTQRQGLLEQVRAVKTVVDSSPPARDLKFSSNELWIDPTIGLQGGAFRERALPDYGYALVLAPSADRLTSLTVSDKADAAVRVHEDYTVTAFDHPARLVVTTTYHGSTADGYRYYRRFSNPEHGIKQLTGLLTRYYPKIKACGVTEWTDDREKNVLTARSTFEVPEFWQTDAKGHSRVAEVLPWAMSERLPRPETTERAFAFGLAHPFSIHHSITLDLPKDWPVKPQEVTVRDDTFAFAYSTRAEPRRVLLSYHWRTLADFVPAARMSDWVKKMAEVRSYLGYSLSQNIRLAKEVQREGIVWPMAIATIAGLIAGIGLSFWLYRYRPASLAEPPPLGREDLAGIGGWLILVAFGVTVRPLVLASELWQTAQLIGNWPGWVTMTDAESVSYVPGFCWLVLAEGFFGGLYCTWAAGMVLQFYRRKASFPITFVAMMTSFALWGIAHVIWMHSLNMAETGETGKTYAEATKLVVGVLIWVPYMQLSQRVRRTFRQ